MARNQVSGVESSPGADRTVALAGSHLAKRFGHVQALIDASITVHGGEIVALFGDNGAGKSTFLRVLLGIYSPDAGDIVMGGEKLDLSSIRDAQTHGVEAVHQDLALAPDLSVIDNMFMGHEVVRRGIAGRIGVLARKRMAEQTDEALRQLAIKLPSVYIPVRDLSGGQRQAVAIARAVMWARTAVLLDEPTAALGARQSEVVCDLLRTIAARGLAVLVVSHDLPRILKVADRVTILWRGRTATDENAADLTVPDVVAAMVGYEGRTA
jgi:simple sugar transport system ATP-binding protein